MTAAPAPIPVASLDALHLRQLNRSLHRARWFVVALVFLLISGSVIFLAVQDIDQGTALRADCPLLRAVAYDPAIAPAVRSGAAQAYAAHGCAPALSPAP